MQRNLNNLLLSASDVAAFQACHHRTWLDWRATTDHDLRKEKIGLDDSAQLIAQRGIEHERAHLGKLRAQGLSMRDISSMGGTNEARAANTLEAMRDGVEVIYQGILMSDGLIGHADFLMRVNGTGSDLGKWSYEVADTKLARSPQPKFLLQLSFYSRLLATAQGADPVNMHVVLGDQSEHTFQYADHSQSFEALLSQMTQMLLTFRAEVAPVYPEPCAACDTCHWRKRCNTRREADDHLCQVANIRRTQWLKLQSSGIATLEALAKSTEAIPEAVKSQRMQPETWQALRSQASLQYSARVSGQRQLELLPIKDNKETHGQRGFLRLPRPDAGDLFFDMEGNPLEPGGLEYLFGLWHERAASFDDVSTSSIPAVNYSTPMNSPWQFRTFWAHDRGQERLAFESFMDFTIAWLRRHPSAHLYHYASYEETALKRLARQHGTREDEVDELLRKRKLVDLYKVVREGLRISEPSYSIKHVEHFYRSKRQGDVQNAGASIVFYERWQKNGNDELLDDIALYNRDDVESTQQLRDWLLTLRPPSLSWFEPLG